MILHSFTIVALIALLVLGLSLLVAALWKVPQEQLQAPDSWKKYRFGFATYALIFVAFDMEMIFMYPWAVVFAELGLKAFLDMLVFIALLGGGIAYAWGMGALQWE